jgi:hypothetical protein
VSAEHHCEFSAQVVRETVRFIKGHIDSRHLSVLGDEHRLSTPE